jgi:hypothetical protein
MANSPPPGARLASRPSPNNALDFGWTQHIGAGTGWTGDISIGQGDNRSSIVIDIDFGNGWDALIDAVKSILGYSVAQAGPTGLSRKRPWRNPSIPSQIAAEIAGIQGIRPITRDQNAYGPFPNYEKWRLTIGFIAPPYRILSDDEMAGAVALDDGGEWLRWTSREVQPATQFLTKETGSLFYQAGPSLGGTVKSSTSSRYETILFLYKWWYLPLNGVFDRGGNGLPSKIMPAVGCVNSTDWNGFLAGTLLLEAPRIENVSLPCILDTLGNPIFDAIPYGCHVTFPMLYKDPPRGSFSIPGGLGAETWKYRGHNLLIDPDGLYYPAWSSAGKTLYNGAEFRDIWKMNV